MTAMDSYEVLGILSILSVWLCCGFLVYKWPGKLNMSLSQHAAQTRAASVYYAVLLIPAVTGFYLFMSRWFIPTFKLDPSVRYILLAGTAGQYVACLIPDTKGLKSHIHQIAAYTMAATLSFMVVYLVFAANISMFSRVLNIVILVAMIYLYGLFLFVPKSRQKFLIYQSLYVILFHLAILSTTYINH
jgi:hypothetical protein